MDNAFASVIFRRMLPVHHISVFVLALSLSACTIQTPGDDDVSESESTSESSTGDSSTETGESTTGESTTGESTTGETTESSTGETGETGGEAEAACTAVCETFASCDAGDPACLADCVAELTELGTLADQFPECIPAQLALLECLAGLSCDEVAMIVGEGVSPTCDAAFQAAEAACGGECSTGSEISPNPGECSFEHQCTSEPLHEVSCDGVLCVCLEDGVEVGSCEAVSFCSDLDAASQSGESTSVANACCGWSI